MTSTPASETILVADDDKGIARLTSGILDEPDAVPSKKARSLIEKPFSLRARRP